MNLSNLPFADENSNILAQILLYSTHPRPYEQYDTANNLRISQENGNVITQQGFQQNEHSDDISGFQQTDDDNVYDFPSSTISLFAFPFAMTPSQSVSIEPVKRKLDALDYKNDKFCSKYWKLGSQ